MREIKFRLYDKVNKNMVYPSKRIYINMFGKVVLENTYDGEVIEANVEDYELMQYVGLKDVNKEDIYEEDIVKVLRQDSFKPYIAYVYFSNGCYGTAWYNPINHQYVFVPLDNWQIVKIGNTYEDPELLELQ